MIPYFARRRRFFYSPDSLQLLHPQHLTIYQKVFHAGERNNGSPAFNHIFLCMTSPALIAAGEVSLYFITESATTALRYALYTALTDKMELLLNY